MGQGDYELSADELDTPKWEREQRNCDTGECPGCGWCAEPESERWPVLTATFGESSPSAYLDYLREARAEAIERQINGEAWSGDETGRIEHYHETIRQWMRALMARDTYERRPI